MWFHELDFAQNLSCFSNEIKKSKKNLDNQFPKHNISSTKNKKQRTYDNIENFDLLRLVSESCIIFHASFDAPKLPYTVRNGKRNWTNLTKKQSPYGINPIGTVRKNSCITNQTGPSSHTFSHHKYKNDLAWNKLQHTLKQKRYS